MGPVGGRGFGGSVKFADGKTSSANVPHLNVWGFDIGLSAAEFPQPKKTRVFGVNRALEIFITNLFVFTHSFTSANASLNSWKMLLSDGPVENMFGSSAYWTNERLGQLSKFNLHKIKIIVVPILTLGEFQCWCSIYVNLMIYNKHTVHA